MRKIGHFPHLFAGAVRPSAGVLSPTLLLLGVAFGSLFAVGCGSQDNDRELQPAEVGMAPTVKAIFNDGETQLFEVKRGLQFPILQPSDAAAAALNKQAVEPYGHMPWITNKDV